MSIPFFVCGIMILMSNEHIFRFICIELKTIFPLIFDLTICYCCYDVVHRTIASFLHVIDSKILQFVHFVSRSQCTLYVKTRLCQWIWHVFLSLSSHCISILFHLSFAIRHIKFVQTRTIFNVRYSKSMRTPSFIRIENQMKIKPKNNKFGKNPNRYPMKINVHSSFFLFLFFFRSTLFVQSKLFLYESEIFHKNSTNFTFNRCSIDKLFNSKLSKIFLGFFSFCFSNICAIHSWASHTFIQLNIS